MYPTSQPHALDLLEVYDLYPISQDPKLPLNNYYHLGFHSLFSLQKFEHDIAHGNWNVQAVVNSSACNNASNERIIYNDKSIEQNRRVATKHQSSTGPQKMNFCLCPSSLLCHGLLYHISLVSLLEYYD